MCIARVGSEVENFRVKSDSNIEALDEYWSRVTDLSGNNFSLHGLHISTLIGFELATRKFIAT